MEKRLCPIGQILRQVANLAGRITPKRENAKDEGHLHQHASAGVKDKG